MEFIQANWEWFLLGFMIVEKAIKLSPSKSDDMLLDMIIKPIIEKIKPKK
tara:strand:+ start:1890 stop:2039 length:150 start_codon:yes stop_codon:yes gene_type:complete